MIAFTDRPVLVGRVNPLLNVSASIADIRLPQGTKLQGSRRLQHRCHPEGQSSIIFAYLN